MLLIRLRCMRDQTRRALHNSSAFRAGDWRPVQVEKTRAAVFAKMFATEFWSGHGKYLLAQRRSSPARACKFFGPVSGGRPFCQMEVELGSRFNDMRGGDRQQRAAFVLPKRWHSCAFAIANQGG